MGYDLVLIYTDCCYSSGYSIRLTNDYRDPVLKQIDLKTVVSDQPFSGVDSKYIILDGTAKLIENLGDRAICTPINPV